MNKIIVLVVIIILVVVGIFVSSKKEKPEENRGEVKEQRQVEGNKEDLISFSILPNQKVSGLVPFQGVIKGAYFFEANIGIAILDANKNKIKQGNAMSTTDWMTTGPISFEGKIDLTGLPKGPAYLEIQEDDPSDLPHVPEDKYIQIPIVIE